MTDPAEPSPDDKTQEQEDQPTAPASIPMSMRAFASEEEATSFANIVADHVRAISRYINLSNLDGVTVAYDYHQALSELDRGYETSYQLQASTEYVVGVAMTPSVLRDGQLKSHIVLNAPYVMPLADFEHEHYAYAVHILAHECAHVRVTQAFDQAFPGTLLRKVHKGLYDHQRFDVMLACWDEFAATCISAAIGRDPTADYETCFLDALKRTRELANEKIRSYRLHGDHTRLLKEVYYLYGGLMKFACYHLGNMEGRGLKVADLPRTRQALEGSWFAPHWLQLENACRAIWERFAEWEDIALLEEIADIADDVLASGGIFIRESEDGSVGFDVPFSIDTMPWAS